MERTTVNKRYRVDRLIGEGGMAEVFLGHDLLLNRAVAIKAMRSQYTSDPTFRARFEREAVAVAGLTHPNIVEVVDVGEAEGRPYLVMEFVHGDTLRAIIDAEGPFAPDDVAALLEQVGSALDFAHEHGLIHRDVKPPNVLVAPDGIVKVVDFGIAQDLHGAQLTETGAGFGTVQYVSPEQANGLQATPSSDVYALGVVAYEMLTGRVPFVADNPVAVAMLHVHQRPLPPSAAFAHVPRQVDPLVLRALEKDPTRRYPSAGAFAAAMSDWRNQPIAGASSTVAMNMWSHGVAQPTAGPTTATGTPPVGRVPGVSPGPNRDLGGRPARRLRRRPMLPSLARRDDIGWTTWLTGSVGLLLIVAMVWAGYRFVPGLEDIGREPPAQAGATQERFGAGGSGGESPPTDSIDGDSDSAPDPAANLNQSTTVPVPDVTGKTLAEATALLTSRGLLVEDRDPVYSESVPANAIAEQDPPPDVVVAQGTTVVIKLSRGSAAIDLDELDLVGTGAEDAERQLASLDLTVETVEVADDEAPAGQVIEVDPANTAAIGDTIVLYVSVGDMVQVPAEVQGRPLEDVERQLERAGLDVAATVPVGRETIEAAGVEPRAAGIDPGDVVGFETESDEVEFDVWLPRDTEITLFYYDPQKDAS